MRTLLISLTAVLLHASPAAAAPTWLPPTGLSGPTTGEVQSAEIASSPAGQVTAVWMKQTGTAPLRYRAQMSRHSPGAGFTSVVDVSDDSDMSLSPDVGIDGAGTSTIVWDETSGAITSIKAVRVDAAGNRTGDQTLSTSGDRPRVAVNASGIAVVIWRQGGAVHAAVRDDGASSFTVVGAISAAPIGEIGDVAVDAAGDAVVAWVRGTMVESNRRPAGGDFAPAAQPIVGSGGAANPVLAVAQGGQATAMWSHAASGEVRFSERTVSPDFAGGGWNPATRASPAGISASVPSVAVDAQNTAIAVWRAEDGGTIVQAGLRPSGGSFQAYQPLSNATAGSFNSRVDVAPDGSAVAVWRGTSGGKPAIQAARRAPGAGFGGVTDVALGDLAADPSVDVTSPVVAVDGEGNAAGLWSRFRLSADTTINEWSVESAGFDAAAPTLNAVSVPSAGGVGSPVGMAAAASDRWTPVSLAWAFGDGTSAAGGAVTHAFGGAGAFNVTVTATDAVGNASTATRPILVSAPVPPPPTPRIDSTVQSNWAFDSRTGKRFLLLALNVVRPPKGAALQLRCSGKRCPFVSKRITRLRKGDLRMFANVPPRKAIKQRARRFRAGQTVQARITAPGFVGKVVTYTLKRRKRPVGKVSCLPIGATKPGRC